MLKDFVPCNEFFRIRLDQLMQERNISAAELARAIGLSRVTVHKYRSGDITPPITSVCKIARFFGVSTDYLLGLTDVRSLNPDVVNVAAYTRLSDDAVAAIHSLASRTVRLSMFHADLAGDYPVGYLDHLSERLGYDGISNMTAADAFPTFLDALDNYVQIRCLEEIHRKEHKVDLRKGAYRVPLSESSLAERLKQFGLLFSFALAEQTKKLAESIVAALIERNHLSTPDGVLAFLHKYDKGGE